MSAEHQQEYAFVHRLEQRVDKEGDRGAIEELLAFYERILRAAPGMREAELSEYCPIYEPLGRLTGNVALRGRICDSLLAFAPGCRDRQRWALGVSALERWPLESASWSALEGIWMTLWNVPAARWVVLEAYHLVPLKLKSHHERFSSRARARGQDLAPLDEAEHWDWLASESMTGDRFDLAAAIDRLLASGEDAPLALGQTHPHPLVQGEARCGPRAPRPHRPHDRGGP